MITSELPVATRVHPANESPTLAAGFPLMNTELDPRAMGATCPGQRLPPGRKCGVDTSPSFAAGRPFMKTSELPVAMV